MVAWTAASSTWEPRCGLHLNRRLDDFSLVPNGLPVIQHRLPKLWVAVILSWGIAFFEYWFAVPANRIGHAGGLSAGQLKIMQECVTLAVFAVFSFAVLGEPLGWRYAGAFLCLGGAAAFMFVGR